jgi:threonine/homoserine efflux transporter RhtA
MDFPGTDADECFGGVIRSDNSRGEAMMKGSMHYMLVSMLTIALGAAWLLNLFPMLPNAGWVWTMGLGVAGMLILALCGVNKLTVVTGPLLIIAAFMMAMQMMGRMQIHQQLPMLTVALGGLMLLSSMAPVPLPGWMYAPKTK